MVSFVGAGEPVHRLRWRDRPELVVTWLKGTAAIERDDLGPQRRRCFEAALAPSDLDVGAGGVNIHLGGTELALDGYRGRAVRRVFLARSLDVGWRDAKRDRSGRIGDFLFHWCFPIDERRGSCWLASTVE